MKGWNRPYSLAWPLTLYTALNVNPLQIFKSMFYLKSVKTQISIYSGIVSQAPSQRGGRGGGAAS